MNLHPHGCSSDLFLLSHDGNSEAQFLKALLLSFFFADKKGEAQASQLAEAELGLKGSERE